MTALNYSVVFSNSNVKKRKQNRFLVKYICFSSPTTVDNEPKDKARKPCLLYYTGGRGRTGTSLRTLDFEFGTRSFNRKKTDKIGIISNYFYQKNGSFFIFSNFLGIAFLQYRSINIILNLIFFMSML